MTVTTRRHVKYRCSLAFLATLAAGSLLSPASAQQYSISVSGTVNEIKGSQADASIHIGTPFTATYLLNASMYTADAVHNGSHGYETYKLTSQTNGFSGRIGDYSFAPAVISTGSGNSTGKHSTKNVIQVGYDHSGTDGLYDNDLSFESQDLANTNTSGTAGFDRFGVKFVLADGNVSPLNCFVIPTNADAYQLLHYQGSNQFDVTATNSEGGFFAEGTLDSISISDAPVVPEPSLPFDFGAAFLAVTMTWGIKAWRSTTKTTCKALV